MLEVYKIRKAFNGFTAVDDVTLAVPARGITAVIGPNGEPTTRAIRTNAVPIRTRTIK